MPCLNLCGLFFDFKCSKKSIIHLFLREIGSSTWFPEVIFIPLKWRYFKIILLKMGVFWYYYPWNLIKISNPSTLFKTILFWRVPLQFKPHFFASLFLPYSLKSVATMLEKEITHSRAGHVGLAVTSCAVHAAAVHEPGEFLGLTSVGGPCGGLWGGETTTK